MTIVKWFQSYTIYFCGMKNHIKYLSRTIRNKLLIIVLCLFSLTFSNCFQWGSRNYDNYPKQTALDKTYNYKGKVIIIGAGVSGPAAAKILAAGIVPDRICIYPFLLWISMAPLMWLPFFTSCNRVLRLLMLVVSFRWTFFGLWSSVPCRFVAVLLCFGVVWPD